MGDPIKFCNSQHPAKDCAPGKLACLAHMGSERVMDCNYTIEDIHFDPDRVEFYISPSGKRIVRECLDFELPSTVRHVEMLLLAELFKTPLNESAE
jgi:hypothetical protein